MFSSVTNFVWDDVEEDDDDDDPFSIPNDKSLKALGKYKSIRSVKTREVIVFKSILNTYQKN